MQEEGQDDQESLNDKEEAMLFAKELRAGRIPKIVRKTGPVPSNLFIGATKQEKFILGWINRHVKREDRINEVLNSQSSFIMEIRDTLQFAVGWIGWFRKTKWLVFGFVGGIAALAGFALIVIQIYKEIRTL